MPNPRFTFDRFELLPAQRRLLCDGEIVVLRTRAFDLLVALAERAGQLVTKNELLELVWPGVVVEENNIAAQIVSLRKVLGNHVIETVPGRGYRFTAEMREAPVPEPVAAPPRPAALGPVAPALARLHGREGDLQRLEQALAAAGCVTLVGAGGVGKTALAKAVAARAAPVAWVDLAALDDARQLHGAVCRALGLESAGNAPDDDARIAAALATGPRLVVLDNAEHLIDAVAASASRWLALCPTASLLVTSQLPLRIAGERVQALEPLALPDAAQTDAAALSTPALSLLVERVQAADPRFPIGADAIALLRELCARLDGLPLALEMAAAIVPLLGAQGALGALDDRFTALRRGQRGAPARHRTLRAAIEWSHGLLQPIERQVLHRLGVFTSSFSLELATTAAGDAADRWDTLDALSELVDRSLVCSLHVDPPRYRLLETVRSFAIESLASDTDRVMSRAVKALTEGLAAGAGRGLADPAAELDNVPGFLAWARVHDHAGAIALTLAAANVATWTPWLGEAARWVEACEALLGDDIPLALQAEWWRDLARFQTFVRGPRTVEAARRAVEIERGLGNDTGLFWSLIPLLRSRALAPDEFETLRRQAESLIEAHPEWPSRQRIVLSGSLAMEYRRRGDFASAWVHQQSEAELARSAGLHQLADNAESNLAATLVGLGRHAEALACIDALLLRSADAPTPIGAHGRVQRLNALIGLGRLDDADTAALDALQWAQRFDVLDVVQVLAQLSALLGRVRTAAMLLGHYRESLAARGAEPPPDAHAPWRQAQRIVEEGLSEPLRRELLERGARLDLDGHRFAVARRTRRQP